MSESTARRMWPTPWCPAWPLAATISQHRRDSRTLVGRHASAPLVDDGVCKTPIMFKRGAAPEGAARLAWRYTLAALTSPTPSYMTENPAHLRSQDYCTVSAAFTRSF